MKGNYVGRYKTKIRLRGYKTKQRIKFYFPKIKKLITKNGFVYHE